MRSDIRIAPPNSTFLIMDHTVGDVPESFGGGLVAATASCVAIGSLSALDGETTISISDEDPGVLGESLAFDGVLETPSGEISVCSVLNKRLLDVKTQSGQTRVKIWANHPSEPSEIRVFVQPAG